MDHTDTARNETQMINSMNIQMQRINELKSVLKRFLTFNEHDVPLQSPTPFQQPHLQMHPAANQMQPSVHLQQKMAQQPVQLQQQPPHQQIPQPSQLQQQNYYQQQMF